MKSLGILALLFLGLSCQSQESGFEELTPDEQDYIRERGRVQCMESQQATYDRFKARSAENVFRTDAYEREDGFYNEFKGPNTTRKVDVIVWKQMPTEIYFYVTEELEGKSSYFLRITETQNNAFIDNLLDDHCRKLYTSSTGENGPLTVKYEFDKANSPNRDFYTDTYTLDFSRLAYFGRFKKSRSIETKNADDDRVGTVQSYSSTLTAKAYDFEGHEVATDAGQFTQKFCEQDFETASIYRFSQDDPQSLKLNCVSTPPVGWNLIIN